VNIAVQAVAVAKVFAPAAAQSPSDVAQPATTSGSGASISVSVERAATPNQNGLVTVTVSAEAASSGKGFAFSIDEHIPVDAAKGAQVRVSQVDGKPLPEWLRYEPETQKVVANLPPVGAFPIQIKASVGGVETIIVITEQPK